MKKSREIPNLQLFELPEPLETGPSLEEIGAVFDYWVEVMGKNRATKLTPERRKKIKRALEWYPEEKLLRAIDGCKASPFHQGQNWQRKVYDDIEMILRTRERIETLASKVEDAARLKVEHDAEIERLMAEERERMRGEG